MKYIKMLIKKILQKYGYMPIITYDEAIKKTRKLHQAKFGYPGFTAGEFFGFRRTYEAITGLQCPDYDRVE
jgi:hypothetical protein